MESDVQKRPVEVDPKKFQRLQSRIYELERENYKTQKLSKTDMDSRVRKLIELEVDKDGD